MHFNDLKEKRDDSYMLLTEEGRGYLFHNYTTLLVPQLAFTFTHNLILYFHHGLTNYIT